MVDPNETACYKPSHQDLPIFAMVYVLDFKVERVKKNFYNLI